MSAINKEARRAVANKADLTAAKLRDLLENSTEVDVGDLEDLLAEAQQEDAAENLGASQGDLEAIFGKKGTKAAARAAVHSALRDLEPSLRRVLRYNDGDSPGGVAEDLFGEVGMDVLETLRELEYGRYGWLKEYLVAFGAALQLMGPVILPGQGSRSKSVPASAMAPEDHRRLLVAADMLAGALQFGVSFIQSEFDDSLRKQFPMTRDKTFISAERSRRLHFASTTLAKMKPGAAVDGKTAPANNTFRGNFARNATPATAAAC